MAGHWQSPLRPLLAEAGLNQEVRRRPSPIADCDRLADTSTQRAPNEVEHVGIELLMERLAVVGVSAARGRPTIQQHDNSKSVLSR